MQSTDVCYMFDTTFSLVSLIEPNYFGANILLFVYKGCQSRAGVINDGNIVVRIFLIVLVILYLICHIYLNSYIFKLLSQRVLLDSSLFQFIKSVYFKLVFHKQRAQVCFLISVQIQIVKTKLESLQLIPVQSQETGEYRKFLDPP